MLLNAVFHLHFFTFDRKMKIQEATFWKKEREKKNATKKQKNFCSQVSFFLHGPMAQSSGGSRIFLKGVPTPKVGVLTYYFANFLPKTVWRWKNLDPEGGRTSLAPPWIRQWLVSNLPPTPPHPREILDSSCFDKKYNLSVCMKLTMNCLLIITFEDKYHKPLEIKDERNIINKNMKKYSNLLGTAVSYWFKLCSLCANCVLDYGLRFPFSNIFPIVNIRPSGQVPAKTIKYVKINSGVKFEVCIQYL